MTSQGFADDLPAGRRTRRLVVMVGVGAALAAAVAAGVWLAFAGGSSSATGTRTAVGQTTSLATVARRNLVETESFSGTLGYTGERTFAALTSGTITWIAPEGATRKRGQVLLRVDNAPVILMYGTTPAWRALSNGVANGPDVAELEWNLVRLGFDPNRDVQIDNEFDWATTAAVNRWLDALGLDQTGTADLGRVVFLAGPRRIGQHTLEVGDTAQPGATVMATSSVDQEVTVDLDATNQTLAVVGRSVTVTLPDGSTVPGRISSVGKVAQTASSTDSTASSGTGNSSSSTTGATIQVDIALLRRPNDALDQAPVDVDLTTQSRTNAIAVPVTALVALLGGGYGVEVENGGTTRLVAVTPGLYAGGYVEITRGLTAGQQVVVPQ